MKITSTLTLTFICLQLFACSCNQPVEPVAEPDVTENTDTMKIKITIGEKTLTATLNDSPTAKDFASLLPLTLTLRDYNATEKISDITRKLSAKDAPAGHDPAPGDITYYAPWGNLAIFYKDFSYSTGLISLGKIEGDLSTLSAARDLKASIELFQ